MEQENINLEKIEEIKQKMPADELLFDMAELFKVFGDSTRMKIISALLENELCVGEIADITNNTRVCNFTSVKSFKTSKTCKI